MVNLLFLFSQAPKGNEHEVSVNPSVNPSVNRDFDRPMATVIQYKGDSTGR